MTLQQVHILGSEMRGRAAAITAGSQHLDRASIDRWTPRRLVQGIRTDEQFRFVIKAMGNDDEDAI
jgi:hypothetical protein